MKTLSRGSRRNFSKSSSYPLRQEAPPKHFGFIVAVNNGQRSALVFESSRICHTLMGLFSFFHRRMIKIRSHQRRAGRGTHSNYLAKPKKSDSNGRRLNNFFNFFFSVRATAESNSSCEESFSLSTSSNRFIACVSVVSNYRRI